MHVRDAVESDAETLASIAESPPDVMRNLVHDRTVRVAEATAGDDAAAGADLGTTDVEDGTSEDGEEPSVLGFVSYDARADTVHVTQFGGAGEAVERLLSEPVRFAEAEGMDVEVLVEESDDGRRAAVEAAGFSEAGRGPTFEGEPTVKYHRAPT